jgi:hypothetical protein
VSAWERHPEAPVNDAPEVTLWWVGWPRLGFGASCDAHELGPDNVMERVMERLGAGGTDEA